jgi:hypothetical protein
MVGWVLAEFIPRRVVTLVAGPRNVGKSLVAIWLAAEVNRAGGRAWINTLEDDLSSVMRPRCEVAGAMDRTRLSDVPYRLPSDLDSLRAELIRHQQDGAPDDLIVLDSLQRHVPKYVSTEHASEALEGLKDIAEEFHIGMVVVSHFTKHHGSTVEQAIGGAGAIQNLAKAIYVVGPQPITHEDRVARLLGEEAPSTRVVACERLGIAPIPDSLLFELDARRYEPTDRAEPLLEYAGPVTVSAFEVLQALRKDAAGPDADESKQTQAAVWIVHTLSSQSPMPTRRLEALARQDGMFFSANTFERARKLADVEAIHPSRLREVLGESTYSALPEQERRVHWVASGWHGAPLPAKSNEDRAPTPPGPGRSGEWGSAQEGGGSDG